MAECNGICIMGSDLIEGATGVAHAHPDCPEHGNPPRERSAPVCVNCHKTPDEINEYSQEMTQSNMEPSEYVRREEGTYSFIHNTFYCTECYVRVGMPLGKAGPLDG